MPELPANRKNAWCHRRRADGTYKPAHKVVDSRMDKVANRAYNKARRWAQKEDRRDRNAARRAARGASSQTRKRSRTSTSSTSSSRYNLQTRNGMPFLNGVPAGAMTNAQLINALNRNR